MRRTGMPNSTFICAEELPIIYPGVAEKTKRFELKAEYGLDGQTWAPAHHSISAAQWWPRAIRASGPLPSEEGEIV